MKDLLQGLNGVQREAVLHQSGPAVVFAGAGSGKTRVITTRIARLIREGVSPWSILAVTFTNKAAGEMQHRVLDLCPEGRGCHIATFHSACARWLREFAAELGFTADFSIYDDNDSNAAIKTVLKSMTVNVDLASLLPEIKSFIQMCKTNALFPADVERMQAQMSHLIPHGGIRIYKAYQEYLAQCNAMDFADLLLNMLLLLRNNVTVRAILQKRFRYVLVDEYQDTNRTQMELIEHIVAQHRNLMVVGDDDQSIYSWRGATPANILDFERHYPDAKRIAMEQNYRSSKHIIEASSAMIANNATRASKRLFTERDSGDPIEYRLEPDGELEAWYVAETISREQSRFPLSEVAIFYRTNSQSRVLEDALRRENIPYRIFGSLRFYDRLEIKDLMAYLRLIFNRGDDVSLKRIINVPARGIGAKAIETAENLAREQGISLFKAVHRIVDEGYPKIAGKFRVFLETFAHIEADVRSSPLDEVVGQLMHHIEYGDYLRSKFPDQYVDKLENIHELATAMGEYAKANPSDDLGTWLQTVSLARDEAGEDLSEGVSMMTLHMAKGLEFSRVYLVGVEEGLLPHRNSLDDAQSIEEERRLFYVGMTRAKVRLTLLSASRRRTHNQVMSNRPSRFLGEIPRENLARATDFASMGHGSDTGQEYGSSESTDSGLVYDYGESPATPGRIGVGARVYHATFGVGVIKGTTDVRGELKATVLFEEFGSRLVSTRHLAILESRL